MLQQKWTIGGHNNSKTKLWREGKYIQIDVTAKVNSRGT